ncbi:MAG: hypothetical protein K8S98_08350 [Planctomycetes bacterium]|nr:hypothetical protein [Planctomycetota bacterium]
MRIQDVPHGLNVVIETGAIVYIGRFDSTNGFKALLHSCDVHTLAAGEDVERYVQDAATYGVNVTQGDAEVDILGIRNVRLLRDIPKLA